MLWTHLKLPGGRSGHERKEGKKTNTRQKQNKTQKIVMGEKNASWQTLRKLKQRYFKVFGTNEISTKSS